MDYLHVLLQKVAFHKSEKHWKSLVAVWKKKILVGASLGSQTYHCASLKPPLGILSGTTGTLKTALWKCLPDNPGWLSTIFTIFSIFIPPDCSLLQSAVILREGSLTGRRGH